jgi:clathrin heavy chain
MESEKFITVREEAAAAANVVIIEVANPRSMTRRPMSADAVLMNPQSQVLALRGMQWVFG